MTYVALHKKLSFSLKIYSINVTNPQFPADLVPFTEEILTGKLHFLCSVMNDYSCHQRTFYQN